MRVTALLLLCLAALTSATTTSYHGHRLVSVLPSSEEQLTLVRDVIRTHHLQEWINPRAPGVPLDLLVPPRSYGTFLTTMQRNGISVTVKMDDVQEVIDQQTKEHRVSETRGFDHTKYNMLGEIYATLDELEASNALVSTYTIGTTYEGRPMRVTKVSTGGTKQVIWIDCGIHAREWISPATCQYILDQLTSGSDSDATALLDTYDFHILVSFNPDGYEFSWSDDRLWRKNRVPSNGELGCFGVDINRNFDANFAGEGSSNITCSQTYHGLSAFSENESQAVRDTVSGFGSNLKMYMSIHSYSQLWMTAYSYTINLPVDYDEQYRVSGVGVEALTAVHGTPYVYGNGAAIIYVASGVSADWVYDALGTVHSYTLELRDTGNYGFLLPAEQILPTAEETWAGIKAAINAM